MPPQVRDDNPSRTRKVKREAVKGEADASPTPGAQRTAAKRGAAGEAAAAPRHRQKLDGAGGGGGGSGVQAAATATASTTTAPGEAAAAARKPAPPPAPPSIWAAPASAPLTAEGGGEGGGTAASSAGDAQAGGEAGEAGLTGEAYGGGARAPWHAKIRAAFLVGVGEDAFELFEVARRLKPGAPLSALSAAGAEMLGPLRMLGGGGGGSVGGAVGGAAGGAAAILAGRGVHHPAEFLPLLSLGLGAEPRLTLGYWSDEPQAEARRRAHCSPPPAPPALPPPAPHALRCRPAASLHPFVTPPPHQCTPARDACRRGRLGYS